LRQGIDGTVILPDDSDYDRARALELRVYDKVRPQAVVRCRNADDVAETVRFANRHGIAAVPRSGGHSFAGYSTCTGLVIDVSPMTYIRYSDGLAHLQSGCRLIDIENYFSSSASDVTVPTGWCPTVGIGGLALGGGLGLLSRKHGITSDLMTGARVVLADGTLVDCDASREPDLFWALRGGGGGNFGIVTSFDFTPVRAPQLTSFTLGWSWARAAQVLTAWQHWSAAAPDELAPLLNLAVDDSTPGNDPWVTVAGAWAGPDGELQPLLDRLVDMVGESPQSSTTRTDPYGAAMLHWFGCEGKSPEQCHRVGDNPQAELPRYGFALSRGNFFVRPLPAEGIDEVLTAFTTSRTPGQTRSLDLQGLGGAIDRVQPTATAYVHRGAAFYAGFSVGIDVPDADQLTAAASKTARGWIDHCWSLAHPWSARTSYQNYIDPALQDWREAYYGVNYPRLAAVKKQYDPSGFFGFPQSIG
jgi:FAD/FMN-containing dehydrogenase